MKKAKMEVMGNRLAGIPCWLIAFFVNLAVAMLAICPFLIRDNGYIAMSHDFTAQEIAFNIFINETVKSGNLLWNWSIDLGSNFLESFSFYNVGSIFYAVSLLFPAELMPKVMGFMIILKFAVAGATSAGFLNRHVKNRGIAIMASMLYAFSGFQCSSVVFYHFQDAVAFFPLMLTGLEMLVEEKKRGRLLLACVINVFNNYIFFVGEVIFIVIYYVVKYMAPDIAAKKKEVKQYVLPVADCAIEGALGMAVGGILLLPSVYGTLSNTRVSEHILGESWLTMTTRDWLMLLKAFLTPAEAMNDLSSVTEANWMTNAAYLPVFGILFVLAYVLAKKDWMSNFFKVCFVIAIVPVLNSVFMTFMPEAYRRWFFMLVLVMALATAKVVENPKEYAINEAAGIWVCLMGFYVVMTKVVSWNDTDYQIVFDDERYKMGVYIGTAGVLLAYVVIKWVKKYRMGLFCVLVAVFSAGTLNMSIDHYQVTTDNTNLDFKIYENPFAENVVNYMTEIPGELERDVLPYRYYFDEGIGHTYYNFALTNSLPSINSFISTVHSSVFEFYEQMGVGRGPWTNAVANGARELLSARYVISNIEQPDYTYRGTMENSNGQVMYVYENEKALPIGFTYDTFITRTELELISAELRPSVMLKTLVVEDEDAGLVAECLDYYDYEVHGDIGADTWKTAVEERRAECSEEFEVGENTFRSVITASEEKYAFFSVPYDKYWKAAVNGEETKVLNINGLMAVKVGAGENEIVFNYEYLPLKAGAVCSALGIVLTAVYLFAFGKWGKEKNR